MYCTQCGAILPDNVELCAACGTPAPSGPTVRRPETDLPSPTATTMLITCPVFIRSSTLLIATLLCLPGLGASLPLWLSFAAVQKRYLGGSGILYYLFSAIWTVLSVLLPPVIYYLRKKVSYDNAIYRLYADRLEFIDGFLLQEKHVVPFAKITDVNVNVSPLQKKDTLGTITVSAPDASTNVLGMTRSKIVIPDIRNPMEIHHEIKRLISEARLGL